MVLQAQNLLAEIQKGYEECGYEAMSSCDAEGLGLIEDTSGYGSTQVVMVLRNQGRATYMRIDNEGNEDCVTPGAAAFDYET